MPYTPINESVYLAAYSAALAAMNMSTRTYAPSLASGYYDRVSDVAAAATNLHNVASSASFLIG